MAHDHGANRPRRQPGTPRSLTPAPGFRDNRRAMDFRLTADEERFRREVHDWLIANLPEGWGSPGYRKPVEPAEKVEFGRRWQRKLHEGGWAGLHWPREYGGRGATPLEQFLFAEEYTRVGAPPMIDIGVGSGLTGPTPIRNRPAAQKRRILPKILTSRLLMCHGLPAPTPSPHPAIFP